MEFITKIKSQNFPTADSFLKCKRNDQINDCLVTAINDALPKLKNGLPEFQMLPLDPLEINSISIIQGSESPVNINLNFRNIKITSVSTSTVTKCRSDLTNFILRCESISPEIGLSGDYTMKGQVLVLPVNGDGKAKIVLKNLVAKHELIGEPVEKNGELFMKLKLYKIKLIPEKVSFDFRNLFNGDKLLGDTMNNFLNENSKMVFKELKGGFEDSLSYVFEDISNKLFSKVPMQRIFLDDV